MTKSIEVEAVKAILNKDWGEEVTADVVASAVIRALDKTRESSYRPLGAPLRVGMAFKGIWSSTTWFVAWIGPHGPSGGREFAWLVSATSNYGTITPVDSPAWQWTSPANVREATREKVLTSELGMRPGDKVTLRQDGQYTIEAVFSKGVLMRSRQSGLVWAEENAKLKQYYTDGWRS